MLVLLWILLAASPFAIAAAAILVLRRHRATHPADPIANPPEDLVAALPQRQTVLITGATGFIGRRLVEALTIAGHDVIVLTRDPTKAGLINPPFRLITGLSQLADDTAIDAVVNLAGEPIANPPWSVGRQHAILASRLRMTGNVVRLIRRLTRKPAVLVNASMVGWYGPRDDEVLTESADGRPCFTRSVCADCERAAVQAERFGVRVVRLRIGPVLGRGGGMLAKVLLPFRLGLGGPFGAGTQWISWIALDDLVRLIAHAIATPSLSGPVNATAPEPVRNAEFAHALGAALHRPALLRLPAAAMRLAFGDLANELLLGGQRVLPAKALKSGFVFRFPNLAAALAMILGAAHEGASDASHGHSALRHVGM